MRRIALLAALVSTAPVFALQLQPVGQWFDTFAATTTTWRVEIRDAPAAPLELGWELSLGGAVVDRGQRTVDAGALAQPAPVPVRIPPLRAGVSGAAMLTVRVAAGGATARLEQPVWILPDDPWEGLRSALNAAPLRVFDPDGTLTTRLREAGLEPAAVRNPSAVAAFTNGLVVVAEGVSLRAQRGLVDALLQAAAAGTRVLLLAPADGALALPGPDPRGGLWRPAIRTEGPFALSRIDKRLDVLEWPGARAAVSSSFALSADRRVAEAAWANGAAGWAWLDVDYRARPGGRLLAVGWAPVAAWDAGPAPRHILAALVREVMAEDPLWKRIRDPATNRKEDSP